MGRLLRIFQYVQRYEADWEVAWLQAEQKEAEERKNEPMMVDEDMLGAWHDWHMLAVQGCTVQYSTVQYSTVQYSTVQPRYRQPHSGY